MHSDFVWFKIIWETRLEMLFHHSGQAYTKPHKAKSLTCSHSGKLLFKITTSEIHADFVVIGTNVYMYWFCMKSLWPTIMLLPKLCRGQGNESHKIASMAHLFSYKIFITSKKFDCLLEEAHTKYFKIMYQWTRLYDNIQYIPHNKVLHHQDESVMSFYIL